jgi:hypothetical protein
MLSRPFNSCESLIDGYDYLYCLFAFKFQVEPDALRSARCEHTHTPEIKHRHPRLHADCVFQ